MGRVAALLLFASSTAVEAFGAVHRSQLRVQAVQAPSNHRGLEVTGKNGFGVVFDTREDGSPSFRWVQGFHEQKKCRLVELSPALFAVRLDNQKSFESKDCSLQGDVEHKISSIAAKFTCPGGYFVDWSAEVQPHWHFARLSVTISPSGSGETSRPALMSLLEVPPQGECSTAELTGIVAGSPVHLEHANLFVGVEHPLGEHKLLDDEQNTGVIAYVQHIANRAWPPEKPWTYTASIGAIQEKSQARRDFSAYLDQVKPEGRWKKPMLHYNSWFDMHSWQDEGLFKNKDFLPTLRLDVMSEDSALNRVETFGQELVRERHVQFNSFLWDDGWDDPKTLWSFNKSTFPHGFSQVAKTAESYGSGIGVWMSPWGGYGGGKKARLAYGESQGFETNEMGFSLAGPKYFARFHDTCMTMRKDYNVNMFKFDGVAGDPAELGEEMEAMLKLIHEIRAKSKDSALLQVGEGQASEKKQKSKESEKKDEDDPWINLTTGTWPSPFFLLWADSIWRGSGDLGHMQSEELKGLSPRQNWMVWRESRVYENVVQRASWFPISQLMIHGVVLGSHGEALWRGLETHEPLDFAQETWSFVAMGMQLQELYLTPKLMREEDWDVVAAASKWSIEYQHILRDSHWAFGDSSSFAPYATAAWQPSGSRQGIMLFRNPRLVPQETQAFTLQDALELPEAEKDQVFHAQVVVSLSEEGRHVEKKRARVCPFADGSWEVAGMDSVRTSLLEGEVLVLLLTPTGKTRPRHRSSAPGLQAPTSWCLAALMLSFQYL